MDARVASDGLRRVVSQLSRTVVQRLRSRKLDEVLASAGFMAPDVLQRLRDRSATIHVRWETLLRLEPVLTPLANPDALVRLIGDSLARIFTAVAQDRRPPISLREARSIGVPSCDCGNNPYGAYFIAGEQAFVEAIVLLQAELAPQERTEGDVAAIIRAVRELARGEIDTFCGLCVHRTKADRCRHTVVGS